MCYEAEPRNERCEVGRLGDGGGATGAVRYEAEPRNERCKVQVG